MRLKRKLRRNTDAATEGALSPIPPSSSLVMLLKTWLSMICFWDICWLLLNVLLECVKEYMFGQDIKLI